MPSVGLGFSDQSLRGLANLWHRVIGAQFAQSFETKSISDLDEFGDPICLPAEGLFRCSVGEGIARLDIGAAQEVEIVLSLARQRLPCSFKAVVESSCEVSHTAKLMRCGQVSRYSQEIHTIGAFSCLVELERGICVPLEACVDTLISDQPILLCS